MSKQLCLSSRVGAQCGASRSDCTAAGILILLLALGALGLAACGGSSSSSSNNTPTINNVQPITVNSGPANNYADGAFTSVKVCAPGSSSTCQTITGVLVDTGSSGLRLLASVLSVALPQQTDSSNNPIGECLPFVSFYTWGPVETADIYMAGEKASSVPIQVIADSTFPAAPSSCTSSGTTAISSVSDLYANGVLGVGVFQHDCGAGCATAGSSNPNIYYSCAGTSCSPTVVATANQVQNPVGLFAQDNNGVLISLPAIGSNGAPTVSGSMIFGIGTEANNRLNGATVFTTDNQGDFTVQYNNNSYSSSYIDSGSNGIFFLDSSTTGIPTCPSPDDSFYCPASTQTLSATNVGANGVSGPVSFNIANAETLFNTGNTAFNDLGGVNSNSFDWGLAFFFGRNVFTAINGRSTGQGPGPFWAY